MNKKLVMLGIVIFFSGLTAQNVWAATAQEIDANAGKALERFYDEVKGGKELVNKSRGVLIFPSVIKAGIGIGGEYGEGSLRVNGWMGKKTVDYYSTAAASLGFQLGAQKKSIIVIFMQEEALKKFRASSGWKAGVDASIAVVKIGAGGAMDSSNLNEPILAFIFGQKGLMYNLTLEGAKFTKLNKS